MMDTSTAGIPGSNSRPNSLFHFGAEDRTRVGALIKRLGHHGQRAGYLDGLGLTCIPADRNRPVHIQHGVAQSDTHWDVVGGGDLDRLTVERRDDLMARFRSIQ